MTPSARPDETASTGPASPASPTIATTTKTSHEHTRPMRRNQTPQSGHLLRSTSSVAGSTTNSVARSTHGYGGESTGTPPSCSAWDSSRPARNPGCSAFNSQRLRCGLRQLRLDGRSRRLGGPLGAHSLATQGTFRSGGTCPDTATPPDVPSSWRRGPGQLLQPRIRSVTRLPRSHVNRPDEAFDIIYDVISSVGVEPRVE